ncbi:MAG: ankyrin repeat domain-containing protein [Alphaproteobacteria bacterium]|nr:MAG: ankyrin repeat domain-containing protein [Alphaproteobacteria bacterium]
MKVIILSLILAGNLNCMLEDSLRDTGSQESLEQSVSDVGDEDECVALVSALHQNYADVDTVRNIVAGMAINNGEYDGLLLEFSDKHECSNVVKELIGAGAKINCRDESRNTPLILATSNGCAETALALIGGSKDKAEAKRYVNLCNDNGTTALMRAAEYNVDSWCDTSHPYGGAAGAGVAVVKSLLEVGTDRKIQNKYGKTALMYAAQAGNVEIVKVLLNPYKGAGVNLKTPKDPKRLWDKPKSALDYARDGAGYKKNKLNKGRYEEIITLISEAISKHKTK